MVALLHVALSFVIQSTLFKSANRAYGAVKLRRNMLLQALWSILAPPLFLDWDHLYRQEDFSMSILDCWKRSKYVFFLHNLITLLGNIVLLHAFIPMTIVTNPDLKNLAYSSIIGMDIVIISQILLLGLGFLYFKTCHPWSRLLKAELSMRGAAEATEQQSDSRNPESDLQTEMEGILALEIENKILRKIPECIELKLTG